MNDMKISLSVPATIYSFGETQNLTKNKYVTHAKLKTFYVGKTPDNRVFTKQFSDHLLQTLPGTPVVAYYDLEADDFKGHNLTQYVFGYVPEAATITYEEHEGKTFAVTDVLLFTGREDNIGKIANKIIGKSHSLELDPKTIEYTVVRAAGKTESITFTKGDFIGLSVLGDDEKPAFTGSSFFSEEESDVRAFVESFQEFKKEVEFYKSGGKEMNDENNLPTLEENTAMNEQVEVAPEGEIENKETEVVNHSEATETVAEEGNVEEKVVEAQTLEGLESEETIPGSTEEFITTPQEERLEMLNKSLAKVITEQYFEILQWDDAEVVYAIREYDTHRGFTAFYRALYSVGEEVIFDEAVKVFQRFLTKEEIDRLTSIPSGEEFSVETEKVETENVAEVPIQKEMENAREQEQTTKQEEVSESSDSAALNQAERQELNEYRQKAKIELISSYEDLSLEIKDKYSQEHEKFTYEELDKQLAYELVKSQRQSKKAEVRVFSIPTEQPKVETIVDLVERYKDKH